MIKNPILKTNLEEQEKKQQKFYRRGNIFYMRDNFTEELGNFTEEINGCVTIFISRSYNCSISLLPDSIENIVFDDNSVYDLPVENLSHNVKTIKFGKYFARPLDNLPDSLESIEFSGNSMYNLPLDNLPSSIKKITFGKNFNTPIRNLPNNLECLKILSKCFSLELKNLPSGLKYLYFYDEIDLIYDKEINCLPDGLIEIRYPYYYSYEIKNLPESVRVIRVSTCYKYLDELKNNYPNKKIYIY
jgi:hypothetical protein